jgi:hypothetical protein
MTRLIPTLALMGVASCSQQPSQIRVQNLTGFDFSNVTVMTNALGSVRSAIVKPHPFGTIKRAMVVFTRDRPVLFVPRALRPERTVLAAPGTEALSPDVISRVGISGSITFFLCSAKCDL